MRNLLADRWHPGWLAAWLAALLVWAGDAGWGLCGPLEREWGRQARAAVAVPLSPDLVVIAIDDASLAALGAWPWPRELHARLIDRLTAAGVRRIVHTTPFVGSESRQALSQLERIASAMSSDPQLSDHQQLLGLVQQSQVLLDGDGQLAQSIAQSQRSVLAVRTEAGQVVDWPPAQLAAGAIGIGHGLFMPDASGRVRSHVLALRAGDRNVPSLALFSLPQPGSTQAPGDLQPFWRPAAERQGLLQLSAVAVINGTLTPAAGSQLAGRTAFVGATTAAVTPSLDFIDAGPLFPVQALAQVGSSLTTGYWVSQPSPAWLPWALGGLILVYLLVLPRMAAPSGLAVTALLSVLLLAGSQMAMALVHVEFPVVFLVAGLLAGHAAWRLVGRRALHPATAPATILPLPDEPPPAPPVDAPSTQPMALPTRPMLTEPLSVRHERTAVPAVEPTSTRPVAIALADLSPLIGRTPGQASRAEAVPPAAAPRSGGVRLPKLGRFQLLRELGRGAMGRVYLGEDTTNGQTVAVKTLALAREFEGFALREARQRFQREAMAALRLRHAGIVRVIDAGEGQGYAWIAMELLHGHDLARHTQPTQLLPVPEVLAICACVADALAHAHGQGVVHRDIKPANVMYEPRSGDVKVTDFGIARITDAARTRTGLLFGSPSYMSPEHLAGGQVDGRSDIYSLGVVLFQLLTGTLPLNGRSMAELMHAVAQTPAPDVRSLRPRLPEPVSNIVALALEKRPELRYASAADMAADLRAVRELWQATALPIPEDDGIDVSIQRSVQDVAAPMPAARAPAAPDVPLGQNQPG